jgi:ferrochelatase
MIPPPDHPAIVPPRIGVLLINLGTPDDASPAAVRRYLREFLSDRRVVEIPQLVWQPILRGIVLRTRPKKSAHAYQQVWTPAGSPLAAITAAQAKALEGAFGESVRIDYAMRYGQPAIGERIRAMKEAGCTRILLAPLYPQYCAATTATANDEAFRTLAAMRWQPAVRTLPPYHDDPRYIAALATSIASQLAEAQVEPDAIMASFHGMPERTLHLGDPYHCHCQKTGRLLAEALKDVLKGRELIVTFQSRFGKAKWLEPYTDVTLEQLPARGIKKLAVVAPGFSADCLETLEELAIRGKESFMAAGGEHFGYLACLNDSGAGIEMLRSILRTELEGWLPPS